MHEIIAFLKDATVRGQHAGIDGCYVVRDGSIYSRTPMMQAGIEWDSPAAFTVPAQAVDDALARMKGEVSLLIEQDTIVMKCGRLRSTIRRVHEEPPPLPTFDGEWQPSPPGLAQALKLAVPFMGDRVWQMGVRLMADRVTAFSGNAGIDITVPGMDLEDPFLLTEPVASFIAAQGDPDEIGPDENALWFRWDDGRWVKAQLLNDVMPESLIGKIFADASEEGSVDISKEWKPALEDAMALADTTVRLSAEGFQGKKENITTDISVSIDVPADHSSYWEAKKLLSVFTIAERFNPLAYPNPALFSGPKVRGVICGYRK